MARPSDLERDIKDKIRKKLLQIPGSKFFPYNPYYGESGIPDIIGCISMEVMPEMVGNCIGLFLAIEVKRPGKNPTEIQEFKMKQLKQAGGLVVCVDSVESLNNFLQTIEQVAKGQYHG